MSKETADLVIGAGKMKWILPREDKITAKGKGTLETFWLALRGDEGYRTGSVSANSSSNDLNDTREMVDSLLSCAHNPKSNRLIDWNVDVLIRLLKQIVSFIFIKNSYLFFIINITNTILSK